VRNVNAAIPPQPPARSAVPVIARAEPLWPVFVIGAGAVLVMLSVILHFVRFAIDTSARASISYWHGVCTSAVGQFAQVASPSLQGRCSEIDLAENVMGWALIVGLLAIAAGVAVLIVQQQQSA
jgi:hypothetical protein